MNKAKLNKGLFSIKEIKRMKRYSRALDSEKHKMRKNAFKPILNPDE